MKKQNFFSLGKILLVMYGITILLLCVLAWLMYKGIFQGNLISGGIIVIYVLCSLVGGFCMGKYAGSKKYIWGILFGLAYITGIFILSVILNGGVMLPLAKAGIRFLIGIASGMIGGMIS